jgi:hypothetical protein
VTAAAPRPPWWTTLLLWAGLAVLAVILGAFGLVLWVGYNISRSAPQPDVTALARSGAVRRADQATATWFGGQFARLSWEAPWLRPAGQSVHDQCRAAPANQPYIGGVSSWITTCSRIQSGYYAYAGSEGSRVGALERALDGLGWRGFNLTSATLGADYSTQSGPPRTGLRVTWISPATPQAISQILTVYLAAFADNLRAGANGVLQATPPDPGRIMRAAAAPDEQVLIVTLRAAYATSPASS